MPSIQSVLVVKDFAEAIPCDLPGVHTDREIDFRMDLLPYTHLISILPFTMAPIELKDFNGQMKVVLG